MAIKFRCTHCHQLLGISHRKAGAVVKCPACRAAVQVPLVSQTDKLLRSPAGKSQPGGAEFERALDEAAQALEPRPPRADPAPVPELVDAPPIVPDGVQQTPGELGTLGHVDPEPGFPQISIREPGAVRRPDRNLSLLIRWWPVWAGVAAVAAVALAFFAGYRWGRGSANAPSLTAPASASFEQPSAAQPASAAKPLARAPRPVSLQGRITYTQAGISIADDGARLIALPSSRTPAELLFADGLRPGEDLPVNLGGDGVRKLGGTYAAVATDGSYALPLPMPGVYLLVVLSYHTHRDLTEPLPAEDEKLLASYFSQPRDLLGGHKYVLAEATLADDKPLAWSYDFGMDDGPR